MLYWYQQNTISKTLIFHLKYISKSSFLHLFCIFQPSSNKTTTERTDENGLVFAKPGTKEAALLLVRDKNGRYSLLREPLYLDRCIIAADPAWQSYFEVQELMGKDTFIFKVSKTSVDCIRVL